MVAYRYDRAKLNDVERLPDGRLRVKATFSRVGPLNYLKGDGSIQVEHVTEDELFRADSLETAGLAPVTLNHPPEGMVTPKNWKKYAVGASGSKVTANRADGLVEVAFVIGDEDAINAVEQGKASEVSAGYQTQVEQRADGNFYQTNRVYNHLALVERGRAGPSVRLHLDSDDWAVQADENPHTDKECDSCMANYKGMEMSEDAISAFKKMEEDMAGLKKQMDGMKAKKDSLEADAIATLEGKLAAYEAKIDSLTADLEGRMDAEQVAIAARQRLDAFQECQVFLGNEAKFDASIEPIEWRKQAILAVKPDLSLDGRNDDFVNGMFGALVELNKTVEQKSDSTKANEFKQTLDVAATGGHAGQSGKRTDEDELREDAEDIAAINALFSGGSN
jgi:hypothetical protein